MTDKIDMTGHAPAAGLRPVRPTTQAVIIHHIDTGGASLASIAGQETSFGSVIDFFTGDPDGVATVTMSGLYADKVKTIAKWKKTGIPPELRARTFVPYHFLVDADGRVARMLPLDALGAHAGAWNNRSVAVCCLGSFKWGSPPALQYEACLSVVRDILDVYGPMTKILGHDEANMLMNIPPKGCPGPCFPMSKLSMEAHALPR